jgi:hypothetical protein
MYSLRKTLTTKRVNIAVGNMALRRALGVVGKEVVHSFVVW